MIPTTNTSRLASPAEVCRGRFAAGEDLVMPRRICHRWRLRELMAVRGIMLSASSPAWWPGPAESGADTSPAGTGGGFRGPEPQAADALKGSVGMIPASSKSCSSASCP